MSVIVPAARAIPGGLAPGSAEWLKCMSASKVAAAIGLSPYDSPFSLWHKMAGLVPPDPDTNAKRRGHYLEPALRAWFADQHPELVIHPGGCWESIDRPWQTASPDGLLSPIVWIGSDYISGDVTALLECKSASDASEWGQPGTDEIPAGYRVQGMSQMDVTGVRRVHFAMIGPYLSFAEYVLDYDEAEAASIREQAKAFLDSLPGGSAERRPDIDGTTATYEAARRLHPDIEREDKVELSPTLARAFCNSRTMLADAEALERRTRSRVLDVMGNARIATFNGTTIATRQPTPNGGTKLVAGRSLPDFSEAAA